MRLKSAFIILMAADYGNRLGLQHLETGITAPLTFRPGQRVGSAGAAILTFDPVSRTFVAAGGWLAPKDQF